MLIHCVLLTVSLVGRPGRSPGQPRAGFRHLPRRTSSCGPRSSGWSGSSMPRNWPSGTPPRRNCSNAARPSSTCSRRPASGCRPRSQQRLARVRQKLQRLAADAAAKPSTITLRADAMPLSKVLAAFEQQSGNTIVDSREKLGQPVTDPELKVKFDKTPFWPALDQVLDQAGLTLYPFAEQPGLNVVAAPGQAAAARTGRACYVGPFRIEPVEVIARRELRQPDGRIAHGGRRGGLGAAAADDQPRAADGRRDGRRRARPAAAGGRRPRRRSRRPSAATRPP